MIMASSRFVLVTTLAISSLVALGACSDGDSDTTKSGTNGTSPPGSSGGATGSSGSTGSSGGSGTCTGDIMSCPAGTLSAKQHEDVCSILLSTLDEPAGTKFECKSGPKQGVYLTVNSKEQCVSSPPPATCKVTVGQLLECYKAAKKDACAALADDGPCAPLFAPSSGCTG